MDTKRCLGRAGLVAVLLASSVALLGCGPEYVRDINDIGVERYDSKPLSLTDMERVIRLAAYREEWQKAEVVAPGHMLVTKVDEDGNRSASVDVFYTTSSFSIKYNASRGFHYDAGDQQIDHHYLSMVEDLRDRIRDTVQDITPGT